MTQQRWLKLRQLDARAERQRQSASDWRRPRSGWIRTFRDALGMTAKQLGARMGLPTKRIYELERQEAEERISLKSLQRAAEALDCELVVSLVPRHSLAEVVEDRAREVAQDIADDVEVTMALEDQAPSAAVREEKVAYLTRRLLDERWSRLWRET